VKNSPSENEPSTKRSARVPSNRRLTSDHEGAAAAAAAAAVAGRKASVMDAARATAVMVVTWEGHTDGAPRPRTRGAFDPSFDIVRVRSRRSVCIRSFIPPCDVYACVMNDMMHQEHPWLENVEPPFITPNMSESSLYDYESYEAEATCEIEGEVSPIDALFEWKPSGKQVQDCEHRTMFQTYSSADPQFWHPDASNCAGMTYSFVFGTYEPPAMHVEQQPTLEAATAAAVEAANSADAENDRHGRRTAHSKNREKTARGRGSYITSGLVDMRIFEDLNAQIAFLTQQLVTRERVLQAEKDSFMASVSLAASTRTATMQQELRDAIQAGETARYETNQLREEMVSLQEETTRLREREERSKQEADELRSETQARKREMEDLNSRLVELRNQMKVARDEFLRAESPSTPPSTPPPARDAPRGATLSDSFESPENVAELRRRVTELERRLAESTDSLRAAMQDVVDSRQLAVLKDEEAKRLTETAKRLSEGLKRKMGEIDAFRRELEEEKAFSAALSDTKNVLEKQIAEMGMHISELTKERNDAGRSARLMAEELLSLRPASIELEVWRLWFETEVRNMIREFRDNGQEAFTRKATHFVNTFKNGGADEWVALVVKNRQRALESHYLIAKNEAREKES